MFKRGKFFAALGASAALGLLSGCVVAPVGASGYGNASYANGQYVAAAPPAAYQEVIPVSPGLGYVWVGGFYGWANNAYETSAQQQESPGANGNDLVT